MILFKSQSQSINPPKLLGNIDRQFIWSLSAWAGRVLAGPWSQPLPSHN